MTEQPPAGGKQLTPVEIEAVVAQWARHWSPAYVTERLAGVDTPWCVAAGWALELFRGTPTRTHSDLEIAVPASDFPLVHDRLMGDGGSDEYVLDTVFDGLIWYDASPEVLAGTHQTWLRDVTTGDYLVDVFREPHDGDTWICRHDPSIRLPYSQIVAHTSTGIPYLVPELALLFKAKHARPKDQADFETTVPLMSDEQRATLAALIAKRYPDHPWLAALPSTAMPAPTPAPAPTPTSTPTPPATPQ